jgi:hypothetical protein
MVPECFLTISIAIRFEKQAFIMLVASNDNMMLQVNDNPLE